MLSYYDPRILLTIKDEAQYGGGINHETRHHQDSFSLFRIKTTIEFIYFDMSMGYKLSQIFADICQERKKLNKSLRSSYINIFCFIRF